ncbi:hypothetical protein EAE96_002900 [Botrytis aclada]|nr:hypothetical protein EAE96_002900 [Botrytis aclada]
MIAKLEQSKIDAESIPWEYICPDGTKLPGQLRSFPHGYKQHINLFLKYNFLVVQNSGDSFSNVTEPGVKTYINTVAQAPVGLPIARVANSLKFFDSLTEKQYESLFKKRAVPEDLVSGQI